ncbi:MAG: helix-turn-helix transcriptional regulator [Candidatus Limnocylindrales bacterium]
MRVSTITKHRATGPGSPFACALGRQVRERRLARGLSQADAGAPLTRAFICSVEAGRTVPSLGALCLIAVNLGVGLGELLGEVDWMVNRCYTARHARQPTQPRRGRSSDRHPDREAHPH